MNVPPQAPIAEIHILYFANGTLAINGGAVQDPILCFGLIEWAKLTVFEQIHKKGQEAQRLVRPDPAAIIALDKKKKE